MPLSGSPTTRTRARQWCTTSSARRGAAGRPAQREAGHRNDSPRRTLFPSCRQPGERGEEIGLSRNGCRHGNRCLDSARAAMPSAPPQPVEILLGPQDLRQLLAPANGTPSVQDGPPDSPSLSAPPSPSVGPLAPSLIRSRLRELALGAVLSGEPGPEHAAVAASAVAAIEDGATLRQLAPRRPSLLPQLIRAANDDAAPRRELAAIIRRDPSLVGHLLEMANSSFYRVTERPVESIDRAVVLLGSEGIRSLIAAAAMQPIFRIAGGPYPRFAQTVWEHAWRSANAAVVHAAMVEKADPFAAELLSLVWGLADVVLFQAVLERYAAAPSG